MHLWVHVVCVCPITTFRASLAHDITNSLFNIITIKFLITNYKSAKKRIEISRSCLESAKLYPVKNQVTHSLIYGKSL